MKKILSLILLIIFSFTISSCSIKKYNLTYHYNNGELPTTIKVAKYLDEMPTPEKEKYIFEGWYLEESFETKFEIENKITSDFSLYAKYILDENLLTEDIKQKYISSLVYIQSNTFKEDSIIVDEQSVGSGIIIKKDGLKYYLLTNNHILLSNENAIHYCFAHDNHQHIATLVAQDPKYDLALLTFESNHDYHVINIAKENPNIGDNVISLGNPNYEKNIITFGETLEYALVPTSTFDPTKSNVEFDTVKHSSEIGNGSSGGPLLNINYELIGINYASAYGAKTGKFLYGFAIPQEKIYEFLFIYFKL